MEKAKKQQIKDILSIIKYIILTVLFAIITLVGLGCVAYASIMQYILVIEKYGAIIDVVSFIPHKSAWFFIGIIPLSLSIYPLFVFWTEAHRLQKVYKARKKRGWYDDEMEEDI